MNSGFHRCRRSSSRRPSALDKEAEIFAAADIAFLKDWLAFHFINNHAQYLSSDFDNANFEFFSKTLRGVEEKRERWKRGVNQIDASLGDAVGQIYIDRHFPPQSKAAMDGLVKNLTEAFKERLQQNEWMDEATREQALLKLSTFEPRIGYPTKYTDYSTLQISGTSLFDNALALAEFGWADQIKELGKPVDRERWGYPPQTVNASYNPLLNQITFPAGILQPPFFDPNADAAVNYGAIGGVIGHEIGHGFDDQGREFDEKGRIRNWWSEASNAAFTAKTDKLGAQYDSYEARPRRPHQRQTDHGREHRRPWRPPDGLRRLSPLSRPDVDGVAPVIDGLTGDQRFFLAWAQVWQGKYRDDELRQRLETDPHSPPYFRINGPSGTRCLVRGVRRDRRRRSLPAAGRTRPDLVGAGLKERPGGPILKREWGMAACESRRPCLSFGPRHKNARAEGDEWKRFR